MAMAMATESEASWKCTGRASCSGYVQPQGMNEQRQGTAWHGMACHVGSALRCGAVRCNPNSALRNVNKMIEKKKT